jgi:N-methylhydantoinase B
MIPCVLVEQSPRTGQRNVMVLQSLVGGTGARDGADGVDGRDSSLANQRNTPIEKTEEDAAAVITNYALRPDSGGAGQWRGGTGVVFSVSIARAGSAVLGRGMERFVFRPWGIAGGKPGLPARVVLNLGRPDERELGKLDIFHARPGDVVTIMTPGGGGYGDPLLRDPALVLEDVLDGYISATSAREDYGVVIMGDAVEPGATAALRARMAAERGKLPPISFGPEREAWESVFDDATMRRLNALLMRLGPHARNERRRAVFEAAVPNLPMAGSAPFPDVVGDAAMARARLAEAIAALQAELGETATTG